MLGHRCKPGHRTGDCGTVCCGRSQSGLRRPNSQRGRHLLEGSLARTVKNITNSGGEAIAVAANISLEEECLSLVEQARVAHGPVDILVNNVAIRMFQTPGSAMHRGYLPLPEYRRDIGVLKDYMRQWMKSYFNNLIAIRARYAIRDFEKRSPTNQ